jgi:hypothetical protein
MLEDLKDEKQNPRIGALFGAEVPENARRY